MLLVARLLVGQPLGVNAAAPLSVPDWLLAQRGQYRQPAGAALPITRENRCQQPDATCRDATCCHAPDAAAGSGFVLGLDDIKLLDLPSGSSFQASAADGLVLDMPSLPPVFNDDLPRTVRRLASAAAGPSA
jgi:hypothetical protein